MLETYVGEDKFRTGLINYLKNFQYENVRTDDLWECITEASYKPVVEMMNVWIYKAGYPLLKITEINEIPNGSKDNNSEINETNEIKKPYKFVLEQERFFLLKKDKQENNIWFLPLKINFFSRTNPHQNFKLITIDMNEKTLRLNGPDGFYKFNYGGSGFFRSFYSNFDNVKYLLENNVLDSKDKLNLVNDLFQLSIGLYIKMYIPLQIAQYFAKEMNSNVLYSVLSELVKFKGIFYDDEKQRKRLEEHILFLVCHRVKDIDLETAMNKYSRDKNFPKFDEMALNGYIIDFAVAANDDCTLDLMTQTYAKYIKKEYYVHPVFRKCMYIAVTKTNDAEFKNLWALYNTLSADDQKIQILLAIGFTKCEENYEFLLDEILKNNIKVQDKIYLIVSLVANVNFKDKAINYVIDKFINIYEIAKRNNKFFSHLIEKVFGSVSNDPMFEKSKKFLNSLTEWKGFDGSVAKSLEKGEIRNRFRHGNEVRKIDKDLIN